MHTQAMEAMPGIAAGSLYTRFCAALARLCLRIGVAGMCLLLVAVLYQVVGRYILNDTPTWAESGAVLLVLYVTMLGVPAGLDYLALVIAGALIVLFSFEHILALLRGEEVVPAWY